MNTVFACPVCQGPLLAQEAMTGLRAQCSHCRAAITVRKGRPMTESLVSELLDGPPNAVTSASRPLRPIRNCQQEAKSITQPSYRPLVRHARISFAN